MTPWHFRLCLEAATDEKEDLHDHDVWIMWHTASLLRTPLNKPLPDMKRLMAGAVKASDAPKKEGVSKDDETAMIARLRAYQHRRENQGKKVKK